MHWRYEDVLNLPADVYEVLVESLKAEFSAGDEPEPDDDEDDDGEV